jgi:pimeloyl-ACP methyl ester carboxylesterase
MSHSLFRRTVSRLARRVDHAVSGTALNPGRSFRRRSRAESLVPADRVRALAAIASFYNRPEFLTRENAFLPRPAAIEPSVTRVRSLGDQGEVLDLRWPSAFEPLWSNAALLAHTQQLSAAERSALGIESDLVEAMRALGIDKGASLSEKYLRSQANQTAHARWFRHGSGLRPCVVLIHGYMSGNFAIETRVWPVKRLFASGFDVVLTLLPFHGVRRSEARGYLPPAFPSSDPRFTVEGFRQVVLDHRALFDHMLAGRVASIGVMGMSLGGYSAALLSTLEDALQFSVMLVPLAAIEDVAFRQGRMIGSVHEQAAQRDALRQAQWPISPFARPARVPSERVMLVAGEADQVTGVEQARRLAQHFSAELSVFHGGHLLQAGREEAFLPVWRMLSKLV